MHDEQIPQEPDVTSDPARNDHEGEDWTEEGGATTEGPATAPDVAEGDD